MREVQTKVIDGCTYTVQMLPGTKSWKMGLRLMKMLGPSLAKALDGAGGDIQKLLDTKVDSGFLSEAIVMLAERLDETEVEMMVQQLAEATLVNDKPLKSIFDLHFQGNPIGVVKWLSFAVQANFAPFLKGSANAGQDQQEVKTKQA